MNEPLVFDYSASHYREYTVVCPVCQQRAIISHVRQLNREVYIHVWSKNGDTWTLQDYCAPVE